MTYQTLEQYLRKQKIKHLEKEICDYLDVFFRNVWSVLNAPIDDLIWWQFENDLWEVVTPLFSDIRNEIVNNIIKPD